MSKLQVFRLETLDEMSALIENRGHDFWVGAFTDCDHADCQSRCQNSLVCDDMRAEEVFTHCYTLTCNDVKGYTNILFARFGLGLRRKRVGSKPSGGCVYLLINKNGESALYQRRACVTNDDPTYRLSSEAKLRNTSLLFLPVDKQGLMQILAKTKAFWLSAFSNLTSKEAPKYVINTTVERKAPDKLFSHCYLMDSADCRSDCDELYQRFGFGVRQTRVRAKATPGTVYCLVATKSTAQQASVSGAAQQSIHKTPNSDSVTSAPSSMKVASAPFSTTVASAPQMKEEPVAPANANRHATHNHTAQTVAPTTDNVPTEAPRHAQPATLEVAPTLSKNNRDAADVTVNARERPAEVPVPLESTQESVAKRARTEELAARCLRNEESTKANAIAAESIADKDKTWEERRLKDQTSMIRHMIRQMYPTLVKQSLATGVPVTGEQVRQKLEGDLSLPRNQNKLAAFEKEIIDYWEHLRSLFD